MEGGCRDFVSGGGGIVVEDVKEGRMRRERL